MDNMENISSKSKSKSWVATIIVVLVIMVLALTAYTITLVTEHSPGKLSDDGVLYLNHEEIYVYDSLESALTDTKCEDGPPKPLKEFLPEILAEEKLVYLESTTVGICIDQQITQEEISNESKDDRIVYKIGDYYLAESISRD